MRRYTAVMMVFVLLISIPTFVDLSTEIVFAGPGTWDDDAMEINVSDAGITFYGEHEYDSLGDTMTFLGDVNGDGFEDFLLPAYCNGDAGAKAGKVYLFLGGSLGMDKEVNISTADASFIGENPNDFFGRGVAGPGDVNGDGLDDILIGCNGNNDGGVYAGKSYLIFGRKSGWESNMPINTTCDAAIIGAPDQQAGFKVERAGDMDGDGLNEILIISGQGLSEHKGVTSIFYGRRSGWTTSMNIGEANASFTGEEGSDNAVKVEGGGDINGDGYDDIIIGAGGNDENGYNSGQVYIIYGSSERLSGHHSLAMVGSSFIGENAYDGSGVCSIAGDMNSDGYDDIVIGGVGFDGTFSSQGKVYIIYGRSSPFSNNTPLSSVSHSILGEGGNQYFGNFLEGVGDINGDGMDDFAVSAPYNSHSYSTAGRVYIILGSTQKIGDEEPVLEAASFSYVGENQANSIGVYMSGGGDLNGDGRSDLMFSGANYTGGGYGHTCVYLMSELMNFEPLEVHSLKLYTDDTFTAQMSRADFLESVHIELRGVDGNKSRRDTAMINITRPETNSSITYRMPLVETGINTGIYRSHIRFTDSPIVKRGIFQARYWENITFYSSKDPSKSTKIYIDTPVRISPLIDRSSIEEGSHYEMTYENGGWAESLTWTLESSKGWLNFDPATGILSGDPDNSDVGITDVNLNLTDGKDHYDEHEFQIEVTNVPPKILTEDVLTAYQGSNYSVDYGSDEDHEGGINWSFATNASWLKLVPKTGVLYGTPTNDDLGWFWVNLWVKDGNGGKQTHQFNLTVIDINDRPVITTTDITTVEQGDPYTRNYEVEDIDPNEIFIWTLTTDAGWLTINKTTGVLKGIPGPKDVGVFKVNVTVEDRRGLWDSHEFELTVLNKNDPPVILDGPINTAMDHGSEYFFQVIAEDDDPEDILEFSITTDPECDMVIDTYTGNISWKVSASWFNSAPYILHAEVIVTDGVFNIKWDFDIEVLPSTKPTSKIRYPSEGEKVSCNGFKLKWTGLDIENDPLTYDVYIGETKAFVSAKDPDTLFISDLEAEEIEINDLEMGKKYYWLVIPNDGCSYGSCSNGVQSFKLNSPPKVDPLDIQTGYTGERFKLLIKAVDDDEEDWGSLSYELLEGPNGMEVRSDTGTLTWTPSDDDVMLHKIVVNVYDGYDNTTITFSIDVEKGSSSSSGNALFIVAGAAVLLAAAFLGAFLLLRSRKSKEEDDEEETEIQEQVIGPAEEEREPVVDCDVALSPNEAHAHLGKGSKEVSYEDLYGTKAPTIDDEDVSAGQLKDYIGESIEELRSLEE